MNHPLTSAASSINNGLLSAIIGWRVWLFRTWVARLPVGQLTVTFPSGRRETFDGARPGKNAHLSIHDMRVVNRLISAGDLGLAESFMAGEWSTPDLSAIMRFGLVNEQALGTTLQKTTLHRLFDRLQHARHSNTRRGSRRNIAAHYDLGNVFTVTGSILP
jgi:cyclopropane-fatty-acyl-phospholipid synthase